MAEIGALLELGLSGAEARVYLALLETGPTLAGPIIKITGLHRATAYQVLQRLKQKGMVSSVIEGKKQHFAAADPARLHDVLREKEDALDLAIPGLKALFASGKEKQDVTVYSGVKGIKSVFENMLAELGDGGEYCDFGVSGLFKSVMGPYWDYWQRQKRKKGIRSRVIFNEDVREKDSVLLKNYFGSYRFHPSEFSSLTDTVVYKGTVALFIWTASPPVAVVINNAANAKSYRNQFDLMWKFAKK